MHYYQHHIGDYRRDTSHLTLLEHGIYRQLLDLYYLTESPLQDSALRLIGCKTDDEKEIARTILNEFFIKTELGYEQSRCSKEIGRIYDKSEKARASAKVSVDVRRANAAKRAERIAEAKCKGTHTKQEWLLLKDFCNNLCVKCGLGGHLDKDHILPVYQGGSDSIDNLQPLCPACNSGKGAESKDYRRNGWIDYLNERSTNAQRTLNEIEADVKLPNNPLPNNPIKTLSEKSDAVKIIEHLNLRANRQFKVKTKSTINMINARLKEHSFNELITMIDVKCTAWASNEKMAEYLRPETLFNATKCDGYIGMLGKEQTTIPDWAKE